MHKILLQVLAAIFFTANNGNAILRVLEADTLTVNLNLHPVYQVQTRCRTTSCFTSSQEKWCISLVAASMIVFSPSITFITTLTTNTVGYQFRTPCTHTWYWQVILTLVQGLPEKNPCKPCCTESNINPFKLVFIESCKNLILIGKHKKQSKIENLSVMLLLSPQPPVADTEQSDWCDYNLPMTTNTYARAIKSVHAELIIVVTHFAHLGR